MTVVIDSNSPTPSPLGKQVSYTVSSDDGDIVRMKGVLDIDTSATIILDPDIGDTNTFTFDFQKIIERNLGGYKTTEEGGHGMPLVDVWTVLDADEAFFDVTPTFTELVSTAGGGLVDGASLTPGSSITVINSFLPREQSQTFSIFDLTSSVSRFLTNNSPNSPFPVTSRKIKLLDNAWLSAYLTSAASTVLLEVRVTNVSNLVTISYIDLASLQTADRGDIPVGPVNLNAASLATDSQGSQPIIDSTTKNYTVQLIDRGSEEVTNGTFTVDADWVKGIDWEISGGIATNDGFVEGVLSQTLSLSINQKYVFIADAISITNTSRILVKHDDIQIVNMVGAGVSAENTTFLAEFTTDGSIGNADLELTAVLSSGSVSVDNVSIRSITPISETITFIMEDPCLEKEVHFYWENRLGGLDDYVFQTEERGITVNKKTYIKPLTKDFTVESRGRQTLGGESNIQFSAFSRPLKDNELIWLEELFEDRLSFMLVDGEFIPVTVTRSSVKTIQDNLTQIRVDYLYANNRIIL